MRYIYKRALLGILTIFLATNLTFILLYNMPGDPIYAKAIEMVERTGVRFEDAYKIAEVQYGIYKRDQPLLQQYLNYLSELARGNLGKSHIYKTDVKEVIANSAPWTLFTALTGVMLAFFLATLIGTFSAIYRKTKRDTVLLGLATIGDVMPGYVLAILALFIFAVVLRVFPLNGAYDPLITPGWNLPFFASLLHHAFLPILTYVIPVWAAWFLVMRSSAISSLGEDYVYAGQAKGLKEGRILTNYVARGAILPLLATVTITIGTILGGSILIERVFVYPGMGYHFLTAFQNYDFGLLQGLFLIQITLLVVAGFIADLIYTWVDPRVRFE